MRIDPLTEDTLFGEKTTQRNITLIRNLLSQKFDDFKKWRKNNPIKSGDTIYQADVYLDDSKLVADRERLIDNLILSYFTIAIKTETTCTQTFY